MAGNIKSILERISGLQDDLETAVSEKAEKFRYSYEDRKIRFRKEALKWQGTFRTGLWRYISGAGILTVLSAPVIYGLIIPFVILDIAVVVYQAICFPIYGIKKVRRSDFIVIDRHHLAYLNALQKLNCVYCGYGNGLLAFVSEVAARTEAYWCPIKHAGKLAAYHRHYPHFSDYGDAEHFAEDWKRNMARVRGEEEAESKKD